MQRFENLKVWRKAHGLALDVYRATRGFPSEERYGVTSQLRRAAVSVPCNIAEGAKRKRGLDYARFLNVAEASLSEVQYLILLSRDLRYLSDSTLLQHQAEEVGAMLNGLRSKVEQASA